MSTTPLRTTSLFALAGLIAAVLSVAAPAAAQAAPCAAPAGQPLGATSWAGPTSGSWDDANNWSNGEPNPSCTTAITAPGTYTVTVPAGALTAGLTLGGASGTQTLQVVGTTQGNGQSQESVLSTSYSGNQFTIGTNGVLQLTSSGSNPGAAIVSGNIVNSGLIRTDPGAAGASTYRDLRVNLTNNAGGTVALHADTTTCGCGAGGTWINNGAITTDAGTNSQLTRTGAGYSFTQSGGTITNNGHIGIYGSFTHSGGSTSGNPILVCGNLSPLGPGTASFELAETSMCSGDDITSDIGSGDTVQIKAASGTFDAYTDAVTNHGTLKIGGGAGLVQLHGGPLSNAGTLSISGASTNVSSVLTNTGTINVATGATANINPLITQTAGAINVGGTLNAGNGVTLSGGTITNSGTLQSAVNATFTHSGGTATGNPIVVCGTIDAPGPGTASFLLLHGPVGCANNGGIDSDIGSGDTIHVRAESGTFDVFTGSYTNHGTLDFDPGAGVLQIHGNTLTNEGSFDFGADTTNMAINLINNGGVTNLPAGSQANFNSQVTQAGGTMVVDGTLNLPGNLPITGGTLKGGGTVTSPGGVDNTGGTVHPGSSPGILSITGDYTQGSGGTLAADVAGTTAGSGYSRLAVSGAASLAGTLAVKTPTPQTGDFRILTAGSVAGTFAPVTFTGQTDSVAYDATGVTLTGVVPDVTPPALHITKKPKGTIRTKKRRVKVSVSFTSEPGAKFTCSLDGRSFKPCSSPFVARLTSARGKGKRHTISIVAKDSARNASKPAKIVTRVVRKP